MQWRGRERSQNIGEMRSQGGRGGGGVRIGGLGLIAVVVIGWFLGVDVTPLLQDQGQLGQSSAPMTQADTDAAEFVAVTLRDTEKVWGDVFRTQVRRPYVEPVLQPFRGATPSPCGGASGATGPFYCPQDRQIYLDTDFFVTLERQLGAKGDFAAAYVVAHEVGHAVQDQLRILSQVNARRARVSEADSNALSVRIELQADCFAGIWARNAKDRLGTLEPGDVEEAVGAAKRIGDDVLQRSAGRVPMPHTFTHGTAEQRSRWFVTGFKSGQIGDCDTFTPRRI